MVDPAHDAFSAFCPLWGVLRLQRVYQTTSYFFVKTMAICERDFHHPHFLGRGVVLEGLDHRRSQPKGPRIAYRAFSGLGGIYGASGRRMS